MILKHRRKKHGRFWRKWHHNEDPHHEFDHDEWIAWKSYFSDFIGGPPEKHWLFRGRRFKPWFSRRWGPPTLFNPFVADLMSKGGGLLALFVLHLLAEKPRYGNDIMREIEERTQGRWASNPGAIYPLLNAMEESEIVVGEWEDADKRTRRIYHLTPKGEDEYERLKEVMRPKLEEAISIMSDIYTDLETDEEV
jgi:DNA-binding PadR family transcriptional regulator